MNALIRFAGDLTNMTIATVGSYITFKARTNYVKFTDRILLP